MQLCWTYAKGMSSVISAYISTIPGCFPTCNLCAIYVKFAYGTKRWIHMWQVVSLGKYSGTFMLIRYAPGFGPWNKFTRSGKLLPSWLRHALWGSVSSCSMTSLFLVYKDKESVYLYSFYPVICGSALHSTVYICTVCNMHTGNSCLILERVKDLGSIAQVISFFRCAILTIDYWCIITGLDDRKIAACPKSNIRSNYLSCCLYFGFRVFESLEMINKFSRKDR